MITLLFLCLLNSGLQPPQGFKVYLRNKEVLHVDQVGEEKNLLVFLETNGRMTAVSKDLVDWIKVYDSFQPLYELYCPDKIKTEIENRKMQLKKQRQASKSNKRQIVLTTSDLKKMEPYQYKTLFSDLKDESGHVKGLSSAKSNEKKGPKKRDNTKIIRIISSGSTVKLESHLEPGRYVIFDFFADWCGPCRSLGPRLELLVQEFPGHVALKKIDIQNWNTPVVSQYGLRSIPHVQLFDDKGNQVNGVSSRNVESYIRGRAAKEHW